MSPLAGTECCKGGHQSLGHCLGMVDQGACRYPRHILVYMAQMEESHKEIEYSVTSILRCARYQIMKKRFDYYEPPDQAVARFVGTAVHEYAHDLNAEAPGYIGEERIYATVEITTPEGEVVEFHLSGTPDQRWAETRIVDLKTTAKIPEAVNPEHAAQVNLYAWMMAHGYDWAGLSLEHEITAAEVVYISPNQQRQVIFPVRLWPAEQTEIFLQRCLEPYLPWRLAGEYPAVLPPYLINHHDGGATVDRNWQCDYCPLRSPCDTLAEAERGVSPNVAAYWDGVEVGGGGAVFVPEFSHAGL